MPNNKNRIRIYRVSAIPRILQIARERSVNPNVRTKKALAEALGMTPLRVTGIEEGVKQIGLEEALNWCEAVEDEIARDAILHIYGYGLPPTDPQLIKSLPNQLINYIRQSKEGIKAAERLENISAAQRPGCMIREDQEEEILKLAEEILDTVQSAESVLRSLTINLDLDYDQLIKNWTQEALLDRVVLPSVSKMDELKRELVGV